MANKSMSADKGTPIESLETWLSGKPYWEQYVWKTNLEKDSLTDEDIDQCYQYLSEHLGLVSPLPNKPDVSFKNEINEIFVASEATTGKVKMKILEVKDFENVNALSPDCSVKFGSNLTLVYGSNGSGKSGVGRLLCNACFSRGEREILPNVRIASIPGPEAKATFVMDDGVGNVSEIEYSLGDNNDDLKCFSVFDSESVLIHLDQSNHVNFTPAQIKIFDKVAVTISKLEEKLTNERNARKKDDPFQGMFLDDATSSTATFCKGITGTTKEADFLKHANFDSKVDEAKMDALQKQIDEKKKLDISKKKSQLATDRQNLGAFKAPLQRVLERFAEAKIKEANQLVKDILEKKKIIEGLSVQSFDDGILNTVGSTEWKELISAARTLYESEKAASEDKEPGHCMLCHQKLTKNAKTLFQKYWQFLESRAENELSELTRKQAALLQDFRSAKTMYPKFLATDAGVKVLSEDAPTYLAQLKVQFTTLESVLDDWASKIEKLKEVNRYDVPAVDLTKVDTIINAKTTEESKLVDPTGDIATLTAQWNALKHKKDVTAVKDAGLEYIAFLAWSSKASGVSFSGMKMATTKKRTEFFLVGVAQNYKGVFNQELAKLGCDFNLIMHTSGEQGTTVKEYRLDFAEDYNPSQILSEGEQNACSIADFLTEVQLDKNNCGIVFDDPVTSLDHERKDKIAQRLAIEAGQRQVVVLTHDIVFMSQLAKYAERNQVSVVAHWMKQVNGIPGCVEDNTSPKLSSLASLKADSQDAVKDFASLGAKEQERALGAGFDYLRSACEALIEEVLFAGTIQRYDEQIRVQNLEEVIFDQVPALKIVDLHCRLSEVLLAHNRSDLQRESQPKLADLTAFRKESDELEKELRESRKAAQEARKARKDAKATARAGW
ncbi:MAG: AAA family ATPase [Candidatus Taylorbacteria bacterium]|nr:AAA family ATPase [Candidatus Taylorbacteria bacterium]